jgi:hypothetical protein
MKPPLVLALLVALASCNSTQDLPPAHEQDIVWRASPRAALPRIQAEPAARGAAGVGAEEGEHADWRAALRGPRRLDWVR